MKPMPHDSRPPTVPVFLPEGDPRLQQLQTVMKRQQFQPSALLEILHAAQKLYGHLARETLTVIARALRMPPSRVYGVATFYHMFTLQPQARHACTVCLGTACFMHGGDKLLAAYQAHKASQPSESRRGQAGTLHISRCLGMCGIAPVVVYDGEAVGQQTPEALSARLKGWASA